MAYFIEYGYIGLFMAAFLAATILPLSSEIVLSMLLLSGASPIAVIAVATAGNVLGSLTNYGLGYWASLGMVRKWLKRSEDELLRAEQRFKQYGKWSLLLAWVPIIGDPLTLIAGILRVQLLWFLLLVTTGKCLRYIVVSYFILQIN